MAKNLFYLLLISLLPTVSIDKASAQMASNSISTGKMTTTIINTNIGMPQYDAKNIESIDRLSIITPGSNLPYHEISLPDPALLNQEDRLYDEPIHPFEPKVSTQGAILDQTP